MCVQRVQTVVSPMANRENVLLAGQDAEMSSDEAEAAAELEFRGSESDDAVSEHHHISLSNPSRMHARSHTYVKPVLVTKPAHVDRNC